jgi:hypothetical protein
LTMAWMASLNCTFWCGFGRRWGIDPNCAILSPLEICCFSVLFLNFLSFRIFEWELSILEQ